jgi:hypothetical protein
LATNYAWLANWIYKVLEHANIKLSAVTLNRLGKRYEIVLCASIHSKRHLKTLAHLAEE